MNKYKRLPISHKIINKILLVLKNITGIFLTGEAISLILKENYTKFVCKNSFCYFHKFPCWWCWRRLGSNLSWISCSKLCKRWESSWENLITSLITFGMVLSARSLLSDNLESSIYTFLVIRLANISKDGGFFNSSSITASAFRSSVLLENSNTSFHLKSKSFVGPIDIIHKNIPEM